MVVAMEINDLTQLIIGLAYKVHNALGSGFSEKVYENALRIEIERAGIVVKQQDTLLVRYEGQVVGLFYPDLWIEDTLIIEVKSLKMIPRLCEVQLVNYLAATGIDNGLLINFGSSVEVRRKFREYKPKGSPVEALLAK
jgi:GxxExxY protein